MADTRLGKLCRLTPMEYLVLGLLQHLWFYVVSLRNMNIFSLLGFPHHGSAEDGKRPFRVLPAPQNLTAGSKHWLYLEEGRDETDRIYFRLTDGGRLGVHTYKCK